MAKKGYVLRKDIELVIASELENKGEKNTLSKARAYISDYKKEVEKNKSSALILNAGSAEREQYKCQELGEWLYQRRGPLKEFRTSICPCNIDFDLSVNESMELADASIALNSDDADSPKALINKLLEQDIAHQKETANLKKTLAEFEIKAAKTKERQRAAGKAGGRGRTNW
jgi:hypothetical protein